MVVLGARLVGTDRRSRFIEWLYGITGQRDLQMDTSWETRFGEAGFSAQVVRNNFERSQVWLLVAERLIQDDRG